MLTFREIQSCEGYYYNVRSGHVLRNVGPGETRCWSEGSWIDAGAGADLDVAQFELVTADVRVPFQEIRREVARWYGCSPSGHMINRQTAVQDDGRVVTEQADLRPADHGTEAGG